MENLLTRYRVQGWEISLEELDYDKVVMTKGNACIMVERNITSHSIAIFAGDDIIDCATLPKQSKINEKIHNYIAPYIF